MRFMLLPVQVLEDLNSGHYERTMVGGGGAGTSASDAVSAVRLPPAPCLLPTGFSMNAEHYRVLWFSGSWAGLHEAHHDTP